jgi:hypothetical protein
MNLPAAPPALGVMVFGYTSSGTLTISVASPGTVSAYESAWGVSANTAANGNPRYGDNHKAITIVAAP